MESQLPMPATKAPRTRPAHRRLLVAGTAAIAASLALSGTAAADLASSPPTFAGKWGTPGTGSGQFTRANAVAADPKGAVYVGDCASVDAGTGDRVQKFTADGAFLLQWGSTGSADGQFRCPTGLAVDSANNVLVAACDWGIENGTLQKFTDEGVFIGRLGTAAGLRCPEGVTIDGAGTIYVADGLKDQVFKLDAAGNLLGTIGTPGEEGIEPVDDDGHLDKPTSVGIDPAGNVYVTDWWNDRIQKFSASGAFQTKWGSTGQGDGQVNGAADIAIDSTGYIYLADDNRVQKFDGNGRFVTKWGGEGSGDGQFQYPIGVAIDAPGNLYVADLNNDRVDKFTYAPQVALGGKRTQKVKGAIAVDVTCKLAGCTASATGSISVPGAAKRYKLKSTAIELPANGKGRLKLKLKGKAKKAVRSALAKKRKLKAKVRVSAQGAIGNPVTADRTVRLRG